jgi:hypothetical protein
VSTKCLKPELATHQGLTRSSVSTHVGRMASEPRPSWPAFEHLRHAKTVHSARPGENAERRGGSKKIFVHGGLEHHVKAFSLSGAIELLLYRSTRNQGGEITQSINRSKHATQLTSHAIAQLIKSTRKSRRRNCTIDYRSTRKSRRRNCAID